MRKKIVAANWKMNLNEAQAIRLAFDIQLREKAGFNCDVILFPSFVFLTEVKKVLHESQSHIKLGAQNCAQTEGGAFTGEVSANQLKSIGVEYVIIGHSERREHYSETGASLKLKLKLALKHGLKPVFCCGEPLQVRNENAQQNFVLKQLQESLFDFSEEDVSNIIIAYEPVWAIGTGLNAKPEQAQEMHAFIRQQIAAKYSDAVANQTHILYGGSCKPDNVKPLFACPDVDGGLIGGASLEATDFLAIIDATK